MNFYTPVLNTKQAKAIYADDLMTVCESPMFVEWDSNTLNTPYKSGLTDATAGFAFVFGSYNGWQTVFAIPAGRQEMFIHSSGGGIPTGWFSGIVRNTYPTVETMVDFNQIAIEQDADGLYVLHFYKNATWIGKIKSAPVSSN